MSSGREQKNLSLLTIGLFLGLIRTTATEDTHCPAGWIGPKCKFKCHCTSNMCDDNGVCYGGASCKPPYFGPACQYVDLVQFGTTSGSQIFDSNDATCTDATSKETVFFDKEQRFTFLRMVFQKWPETLTKGDMTNVSITYTNIKHNITRRCVYQSFFFVSNDILDVQCQTGELITQVNVRWMFNVPVCSIYISGGRNLAIRANVTSSSIEVPWKCSNAVDGVEPFISSCFKSSTNDTEASLTIRFSGKIKINRVSLKGCSDCQMLLKTDTESFRFSPGEAGSLKSNLSLEWPIALSGVPEMIQIQPSIKGSQLMICELVALGDCVPGFFGLQCDKQCTQQCAMKSCGLLSDACAVCKMHSFGPTCSKSCSYCGGNGMCNPTNGSCVEGCKDPKVKVCEYEVTTNPSDTTMLLDKAVVAKIGGERIRIWMVYLVLAITLITTLTLCLLFLGLTKRDSIMNLITVGEDVSIQRRRLSRIRSESIA